MFWRNSQALVGTNGRNRKMVEIGRRPTALVNLRNQDTGNRGRDRPSFNIPSVVLEDLRGLRVARGPKLHEYSMCPDGQSAGVQPKLTKIIKIK